VIVEVFTRYSDFCGNADTYHYGFFEVDSIEHAHRIFPARPICGWVVEEINAQICPSVTPTFPKEK
jgi:hypothetical protein